MRWVWLLLVPLTAFAHHTVVESDEARYNGKTITLRGDVIVENAMGRVTAEKAVLIRDEEKQTKIDFPWIELTEAVTLTLPAGNQLCCDAVFLDYTHLTSHFTGNPQIHYTEERGEVWADEAYIDYIEAEGSVHPTKIRLLNRIKLLFPDKEQYALADELTYYPEEELMVLEGNKGNRVLFFDKERNMQLSAPTVRASRNPETNKETIRGIGDVRFLFGEEELLKFKERFQW